MSWTGHQSITSPHIDKQQHILTGSLVTDYPLGLWEEDGAHGENVHKHKENRKTPHRKTLLRTWTRNLLVGRTRGHNLRLICKNVYLKGEGAVWGWKTGKAGSNSWTHLCVSKKNYWRTMTSPHGFPYWLSLAQNGCRSLRLAPQDINHNMLLTHVQVTFSVKEWHIHVTRQQWLALRTLARNNKKPFGVMFALSSFSSPDRTRAVSLH